MSSHPQLAQDVARFGPYELDFHSHELRKRGLKLKLEGQPLQILEILLRKPGELVTRDELREELWPPGTFVDYEQSINAAIKRLRQVLGDSAETPVFIETLPRRGYRFVYPLATPVSSTGPRRKLPVKVVIVTVTLSLLAVAVLFIFWRPRPSGVSGAHVTIVSLVNSSGDPNQELLAANVTQGLIDELSRIHAIHLKVATDPTSAHPDGALITGSVSRHSGVVTINLARSDSAGGKPLWEQQLDYDSRDLKAAQRDAARVISEALNIELSVGEAQRLASRRAAEVQALLLKARTSELIPGQANALTAIDLYEQACAKGPNDALAHALLAQTYTRDANMGFVAPLDIWSKAKTHALKAVELDPTLPEAHVALSNVYRQLDWDFHRAIQEAQRAIDLDIHFAEAYDHYAAAAVTQGRFEEAIAMSRRALELDPGAINYLNRFLIDLYAARKYSEAIQEAAKALTKFPSNQTIPHMVIGLSYLQMGQVDRALTEVQARFGVPSAGRRTLSALPFVYAKAGRHREAQQAMNEILQLAGTKHIQPYEVAIAYTGLGDKERAILWLEKAYAERDTYMQSIATEPMFDALRSDPRFLKIARRVKAGGKD